MSPQDYPYFRLAYLGLFLVFLLQCPHFDPRKRGFEGNEESLNKIVAIAKKPPLYDVPPSDVAHPRSTDGEHLGTSQATLTFLEELARTIQAPCPCQGRPQAKDSPKACPEPIRILSEHPQTSQVLSYGEPRERSRLGLLVGRGPIGTGILLPGGAVQMNQGLIYGAEYQYSLCRGCSLSFGILSNATQFMGLGLDF